MPCGSAKKKKKRSLSYPRSSRFSPILYSRSFIVFCFTLRTMIFGESNFCEGCKVCVSRFTFLHEDVQVFRDHLLKRQSLPFLLCQRSVDYIYVCLFEC